MDFGWNAFKIVCFIRMLALAHLQSMSIYVMAFGELRFARGETERAFCDFIVPKIMNRIFIASMKRVWKLMQNPAPPSRK